MPAVFRPAPVNRGASPFERLASAVGTGFNIARSVKENELIDDKRRQMRQKQETLDSPLSRLVRQRAENVGLQLPEDVTNREAVQSGLLDAIAQREKFRQKKELVGLKSKSPDVLKQEKIRTERLKQKKLARGEQEAEAEKKEKLNKASTAFAEAQRKWKLVDNKIDQALNQVGPFTAGFGSFLNLFPSTDATGLEETLETIKANMGFDALQRMRENSPTGGSLGQISDRETRILQLIKASLAQRQSPEQLRNNLMELRKELKALNQITRQKFMADFGDQLKNVDVAGILQNAPGDPLGGTQQLSADDNELDEEEKQALQQIITNPNSPESKEMLEFVKENPNDPWSKAVTRELSKGLR